MFFLRSYIDNSIKLPDTYWRFRFNKSAKSTFVILLVFCFVSYKIFILIRDLNKKNIRVCCIKFNLDTLNNKN